jgi:two-component system alkaline phosphatase synthesis response regulator PhoP
MILVVDDHPESRNVLVRLLRVEGFEAAAAECASVALDLMKRRTPSVVILDCHMPDCDGFMMLEELKTVPSLAEVPVIMFSAGDAKDRERALRLGARDFIQKGSLDWERIREVVRRLAPRNGVAQPEANDNG